MSIQRNLPHATALKPLYSVAKLILVGVLFVGILCSIRLFLCEPTLGWDEAELAVFAQKLSAGYLAQPPLYYWLQYFVFQSVGITLFSIALLKYSLIFLCFYVYHQICRLYCQDRLLAWCATLSWTLMPNISIDLLPHRSHTILSLLGACLTWYWLIKPSKLSKPLWYVVFGFIIGAGFLSKFNYLLFFVILLITALSIKEFRAKLVQRQILISIVVASLVSSIYWLWLIHNFVAGTSSLFKLSLTNKTLIDGIVQLLKGVLIYATPALVLSLFFPFWRVIPSASPENRLLWRYHALVLPLLLSILLAANFHDFKLHWALPLFFLTPLLILSFLPVAGGKGIRGGVLWKRDKASYTHQRALYFIALCLIVQFIILGAWVKRTYRMAHFPTEQLVELIRQDKPGPLTLVATSHWLLGSLMVLLPSQQSFLLHQALLERPLPEGKLLLVWKGDKVPEWVDVLVPKGPKRQIRELIKNKVVIAGYVYTSRN